MPAGKVTVKKTKTRIILSDGSGQSYTLPRATGRPLLMDIDPRIDLTRPIYEQVQDLAARDEVAAAKTKRRKPQDTAA
jgi:hypothetical protein